MKRTTIPSLIQLQTSLCAMLLVSMATSTANAAVTFDIITGNAFLGQTTGQTGDPYWEGGSSDAPLTDFYAVGTTGLNTVGSTAVFLAYDNLTDFNFSFQSFAVGNTVYANPLVVGDNVISGVTRNAETVGLGNGISGATTTLGAGSNNIVVINPDNTYSYSNLVTEDANYTYTSSTINAYSIVAGQDAQTIFGNASADIFVDPINGNVDPQRLINQFEYLATQVDPSWTALTIEFLQTEGVSKNPAAFGDFSGLGYYSYVSYDDGASPVPLPAAFWLFGSAILGLAMKGRRGGSSSLPTANG